MAAMPELALALAFGLAANLWLTLTIGQLRPALVAAGGAGAVGLLGWLVVLARHPARRAYCRGALVVLPLVLLLALPIALALAVRPVSDWDARSIWFFHAKAIYHHGALAREAGWLHPAFLFAHADYPKLLPLLAAQTATLAGYWNEYLPKSGLLPLLLTCLVGFCAALRYPCSGLLLLILFPWSLGSELYTGYADAFLALLTVTALLHAQRCFATRSPLHAAIAVAFLGLTVSLKNEGQMIFCGVAAALVPIIGVAWRRGHLAAWRPILAWPLAMPLAICLLPALAWAILKARWGLHNDLQVVSSESLSRGLGRLTDWASLRTVCGALAEQLWLSLLAAGLLFGLCRVYRRAPGPGAWLALLSGVLYSLGLGWIYLSTPRELSWHLNTSILRVCATPRSMLWVACALALATLEAPAVDALWARLRDGLPAPLRQLAARFGYDLPPRAAVSPAPPSTPAETPPVPPAAP